MKSIRSIYAVFCLVSCSSLLPLMGQPTSIEVSGNIEIDTTWSVDTVRVTGDLTIPDDVKLTIEPGTRVEITGPYRISVEGTINATGTPGDTITFTCHPDSTSSGWHGIYVRDLNGYMLDNDSTLFSHCRFEYGNPRDGNSGACLTIYGYSRIKIRNSVFRNNMGVHSGIYCRDLANILISDNYFTSNFIYTISCYDSDPVITGNRFIHSAGILLLSSGSNAKVINNFFGDNNYTIRSFSSNPVVIGNVICNNIQGMEFNDSEPLIVNNTVCNNDQGIRFSGEVKPQLFNNVIFANSNYDVWIADQGTQPDFYYNNISSGRAFGGGIVHTGIYENNMQAVPGFISPSTGPGRANYEPDADWSLNVLDMMLNAGTPDVGGLDLPAADINGNPRVAYTRIDIGALEYHKNSIEVCGSTIDNLTWYADTVKVTCDFTVGDNYGRLHILPGTVVQFQDYYTLRVEGTIYAIGTEDEKILFTVRDTTGFSNYDTTAGGWGSLIFNNFDTAKGGANGAMSNNDSSILRHCIFEYSKKQSETEWEGIFGGAIHISAFSNLEISHCEFRSNYASNGGAISVRYASAFKLHDCLFENNISEYGGALLVHANRFEILNCSFNNNVADRDGGAIWTMESEGKINGNIFLNNQARYGGAINMESPESGELVNNLICNNNAQYGGGLYFQDSPTLLFANNTIANNNADNAGGGIELNRSSIEIHNSILWGNTPSQVYLFSLKSQPGIYNSIIEGGTEGFSGEQYIGISENILNKEPFFAEPSEGSGVLYDGLLADWSLQSISPAINSGSIDVPSLTLPQNDLNGDPRIHDNVVDIGAFENQSSSPVISLQPQNAIRCIGDSIVFSIQTGEPSFFQWQKDGVDIDSATSALYVIDSVTASEEGNYQCIVSNAYGSVSSNNVFLGIKVPPEILSQTGDLWIEGSKNASISVFAQGTNLNYNWMKDGVAVQGASSPDLFIHSAVPDDEGSYACILSNTCGSDTTKPINLWLAPYICMVTVSPTTGNNLVVWETKTKAPVMAYNLYRESVAAGIFDKLATIPYGQLSVFVDTVADPTVQAYIYKMTAIDTSGTETDIDLCNPHKTIHLIVTTNPELNTTQLQWDRYYGFEYNTYTIYRSSTGTNFDPVHSMSASLNSWTDPDPSPGDLFYRIAVEKPDPCVPEGGGKKAGTGPYSHSLSNLDDNKLKAGENPPDSISIDNLSINENNNFGDPIGMLLTADIDTSDVHSYMLVSGTGDDDNIMFMITGNVLRAGYSFDFETKESYSIRVRSTDQAGNYIEKVFVINITDVDETVGINGNHAGAVQIFPNPFNNTATISFPNPEGEPYRLILTDITGKTCRSIEGITTSQYVLHRSSLSRGMYFLELKGPREFRVRLIIE